MLIISKKTISAEEERFSRTIDQGLNILSNLIDNIEKAAAEGKRRVLAGIDAFKLNDTFGFPLDLTKGRSLLRTALRWMRTASVPRDAKAAGKGTQGPSEP